ncbi:hypothetical protein [Pseudomonas quasicaspiana]|uniref:hypothetical protein n=1 Tax=Pseudomonas quasicaspiana TaxID=2829821 RepID=UPI001E491F00|nr:hypothetical protein [Pseudomonas quasicaspiana]MCD5980353.1 hypothetical protein [Pseudomonas quasicaspiana]
MNISTERLDPGKSELVREAFHLTRRSTRLANKLPPTGEYDPAGGAMQVSLEIPCEPNTGRSELVREAFHLTRRFDRLANKLPPTGDCVPAGGAWRACYSQAPIPQGMRRLE